MVDVSADTDELTIDALQTSFDYEIGDVVEFDSVVVVLLSVPREDVHNRNVIGIDETGDERWTIPESPHGSAEDNLYMSLDLRDGELWAGSWHGWTYRVDPETGELLEHEFTK